MYLLLFSLPGCKLQTSTDTTTERWARLAERGGEKVDSWSANSGDVVLRRRIYKSRTIIFPVLSIKNNSIKCRVVVYLNWFSDKGGECEGGVWSVGTPHGDAGRVGPSALAGAQVAGATRIYAKKRTPRRLQGASPQNEETTEKKNVRKNLK